MKQLPLAPPRCRRFLAVLAGLLAKEAQGTTEVAPTSDSACARQETNPKANVEVYFTYLTIVIITVVAVRLFDGNRTVLRPTLCREQQVQAETRQRKQYRDVAAQAQTTYTAVRGASNPRFQVLPEYSQG